MNENIKLEETVEKTESTVKKSALRLFKLNNSYVTTYPFRLSWSVEHNILTVPLKNKKSFNDYCITFKWMVNLGVDYQGKWLDIFNSKHYRGIKPTKKWLCPLTVDHLKQPPTNQLILDQLFKNLFENYNSKYSTAHIEFISSQKAIIYLLFTPSSNKSSSLSLKLSPYDVYNININVNDLSNNSYLPFYINIDSEFVDKIVPGSCPFENNRLRYPVSITITATDFHSGGKKEFHYVFDHNYLKILSSHKNQDEMLLARYDESENSQRNHIISLFHQKKPLLLNKTTPFFLFFYQIYKEICPNLLRKDCQMFFCSESWVASQKKSKNSKTLIINFFWSAKDLRYFFGYFIYTYLETKINTKNNHITFEKNKTKSHFGFIFRTPHSEVCFTLQILDISRLSERKLQDLCNLTGIQLSVKDDLNKEDISVSLVNDPCKYLTYCREDTHDLDTMAFKTYLNFIKIYEIFQIKNIPCFSQFHGHSISNNSMRMTLGSNVALLFEEYIYNMDVSMRNTLELLSIKDIASDENDMQKSYIKGISMGSSRYLNFLGSHARVGSFVSGGRTATERCRESFFEIGVDVDLSSAYATSLKNQIYCLGIPFVVRPIIDTYQDERNKTCFIKEPFIESLKNVLKVYEKNLVPGAWYMVVSTKEPLSFHFDLIVSKNITHQNNPTSYRREKTSDFHTVSGEQVILTHEIKNGIIVQSTLDIINQIATRDEKKELYNKIHVRELIYYDKRNRCETTEKFNYEVCKWFENQHSKQSKRSRGRPRLNKDTVGIGSFRKMPHYWYGVEMEGFMGVLIKQRKQFQKLLRDTGEIRFDSMQRYMKLINNMLYGVTASVYFNISNLTFANNCTGLCRSAVWIKAKSLNLCQLITDGGTGTLRSVSYWHLQKPTHKAGFNTLTENCYKQNSKFLKPLGYHLKIDWEKAYKNISKLEKDNPNNLTYRKKLDRIINYLVNQHVHNFLKYYNFDIKRVFPYEIENKTENMFFRASTLGRGHYALLKLDHSILYKVRGCQQRTDTDHIPSAIFDMLKAKLFNQDASITSLTYTKMHLVKTHELDRIREKYPSIQLHDTHIKTLCVRVKLDSGKFGWLKNFKKSISKSNEIMHYAYLKPCYLIGSQKPYILSKDFWEYYHKNITSSVAVEVNNQKKFSKKAKNEFNLLIKRGIECDPYFKHNLYDFDENECDDDVENLVYDLGQDEFIVMPSEEDNV